MLEYANKKEAIKDYKDLCIETDKADGVSFRETNETLKQIDAASRNLDERTTAIFLYKLLETDIKIGDILITDKDFIWDAYPFTYEEWEKSNLNTL